MSHANDPERPRGTRPTPPTVAGTARRTVPASSVDVAVLDPELGADDVRAAVAAASGAGCAGVRVHPAMLGQWDADAAEGLRVGVVCGFPTGRSHTLVKAAEARLAAEHGAHDVAVVLDRAAVAAGDANAVLSEVVALRGAVAAPTQLTVVVEAALHATGVLDDEAFDAIVRAVAAGGADAVATATGSHPGGVGGAEQVRRIVAAAPSIGVIAVAGDGSGEDLLAAGAHVVQLPAPPQ
ncbi:2-deoxyribose-5-phosphate aldolase [uncultured Corynebacterium sp.]|uniref:2-deoxyribose-5-phosphate aldolase n=1 Tax=uncultured Corynebacterium sp. TaxID=159447 RepID=UPI0025D85FC9|nr:2-deoxyribose-5-phosphate aldolase [uncultured Corynebacterium sp.]